MKQNFKQIIRKSLKKILGIDRSPLLFQMSSNITMTISDSHCDAIPNLTHPVSQLCTASQFASVEYQRGCQLETD